MTHMKAIWLHQPYPTLIELGVKHWETRNSPPNGPMRPDGVRGMPGLAIEPGERIAVVAAMREPRAGRGVPMYGDWTLHNPRDTELGVWEMRTSGSVLPDGTLNPDRRSEGLAHALPLGVVVCTAVVAEALPIVDNATARNVIDGYWNRADNSLTQLALRKDDEEGIERCTDLTDQLPYGDWRPGRWAWRLTDVESVPSRPVPVVTRGNRQGVCEIEVTW